MNLTTRLILLSLIHMSQSECVIDNRSLDMVTEKKLHDDLKSKNKYDEIPCKNGTQVEIKVIMRSFDLDEYTEIFQMYSYTWLSWVDERLKWDPKDYEGITRTVYWGFSYWTPVLKLKNNIDSEEYGRDFGPDYGVCELESSGKVVCVPRIIDQVKCASNIKSWPYDSQKCTLQYGISEHQKNVTIIAKGNRSIINTMEAGYGPEWTIVDYEQKNNVSYDVQLQVTFTLERNGDGLAAMLIYPAFLLTALTLSTMMLDVTKTRRFLLISFSVLGHFMFLSLMSEEVPKLSADTPTILLFYRSSLLATGSLVIFTFLLMKIRHRQSTPPSWISSISGFATDSYGKYVIWPRWETDPKLISSESVNVQDVATWDVFANIINSVIFCVFVIVYSILLSVYVPRAPPLV